MHKNLIFTSMKATLAILLILSFTICNATGNPKPTTIGEIRSAKLYRSGDQTSFPVIALGSPQGLLLDFDDMDADIKNYYYSFELCNSDWSPSVLHPFEYIKGFQNVRISNYRYSSLSPIRYTHYSADVPDRNCYPTHSGNYLLKVFINGDTTQLAFAKRFVVVETKAQLAVQVQQPYNSEYFQTGQKLQIGLTTDNKLQIFSPTDLKIVILQNNNWATSLELNHPTIYRGNYYEYNDEAYTTLPAAKEFRWLDMRSLRLLSDRMQRMDTRKDTTEVFVKNEATRSSQVYVYLRDYNGSYTIESLDNVNPFWQAEYANVHFSYAPPSNQPFEGRDVYVFGELTEWATNGNGKMTFNKDKGVYEANLFLKQGYYNYMYVTLPTDKPGYPDFSVTEGNYWGTENAYTVLVYYRPFGAQADELIGSAFISSIFQRNGIDR